MNIIYVYAFVLILGLLESSCRLKQEDTWSESARWNPKLSPMLFLTEFSLNFENLPLSGTVDPLPYPGYYWPLRYARLSQRWRPYFVYPGPSVIGTDPGPSFRYRFGQDSQLDDLSPAEKYDLYLGRRNFPLARSERNISFPEAALWEGLCHGQGPAALNFREPGVVKKDIPGVGTITFFSSDIKGLLALAQAEAGPLRPLKVLGTPCQEDYPDYISLSKRSEECQDLNPAAFHAILTTQIGLHRRGFVADLHPGSEIWNYPLSGYTAIVKEKRPPHAEAALGTVEEILMQVWLEAPPFSDPQDYPERRPRDQYEVFELSYWLELDGSGRLIGGTWVEGSRIVDSIWLQDPPHLTGEWAKLKEIYEESLQKGS